MIRKAPPELLRETAAHDASSVDRVDEGIRLRIQKVTPLFPDDHNAPILTQDSWLADLRFRLAVHVFADQRVSFTHSGDDTIDGAWVAPDTELVLTSTNGVSAFSFEDDAETGAAGLAVSGSLRIERGMTIKGSSDADPVPGEAGAGGRQHDPGMVARHHPALSRTGTDLRLATGLR